ncbi:MAG: hypothetical protein ACPGJS_11400 [Flammeovirgaceae bacterium]
MKRPFLYFAIIFWLIYLSAIASTLALGPDTSKIQWNQEEVSTYALHTSFAGQTVLYMAYADHHIKNPRHWTNDVRKKYIYEVDVVLTKYPKNKNKWLTHYDSLMKDRVLELYKLIPELEQNRQVRWKIVLQTDCDTEADAKEMFHGVVVKYKLHLTSRLKRTLNNMRNIVNGKESFEDSVVYRVFDRHPAWQNMLVVNDWTGSMYQYGAQAVLWHRLNLIKRRDQVAIDNFIFFNDGNMLPDDEKQIGNTGGIYQSKGESIKKLAHTMREVMLSGFGGDKPENDVEAILYGLQHAANFRELVLIADNRSAVRDMELLEQVNVPIKIILCGTDKEKPIHPDYLKMAQLTNGSIHTIAKDIMNLADKKEGDTIEVLGVTYILADGQFRPISQ